MPRTYPHIYTPEGLQCRSINDNDRISVVEVNAPGVKNVQSVAYQLRSHLCRPFINIYFQHVGALMPNLIRKNVEDKPEKVTRACVEIHVATRTDKRAAR